MRFVKNYFSQISLIVSALLFFYVSYKSEIYWDGSKRLYYKNYYLFSFIILSFSISTFFMNEKIKEYSIITILSICFSLYLFESYLTFKPKASLLLDMNKKVIEYKKKTGLDYDLRSKFEVYKDLKKKMKI